MVFWEGPSCTMKSILSIVYRGPIISSEPLGGGAMARSLLLDPPTDSSTPVRYLTSYHIINTIIIIVIIIITIIITTSIVTSYSHVNQYMQGHRFPSHLLWPAALYCCPSNRRRRKTSPCSTDCPAHSSASLSTPSLPPPPSLPPFWVYVPVSRLWGCAAARASVSRYT